MFICTGSLGRHSPITVSPEVFGFYEAQLILPPILVFTPCLEFVTLSAFQSSLMFLIPQCEKKKSCVTSLMSMKICHVMESYAYAANVTSARH